jgi:hypothetical protein
VLCISAAQLVVGLCLLGIYEGYKAYYYDTFIAEEDVSNVFNETDIQVWCDAPSARLQPLHTFTSHASHFAFDL